ncbi:B3 domain-containing protein [Drosera capensis]
MACNLRPTKEPRGGAAEKPGIHSNGNSKKSPPRKAIGRPRSSLPTNSSGKSGVSRTENGRAENLRKSASTPRKKPGVTGNTSGRSLAQQVSGRPIRPRKPAPTNSSVELTAGSGEDVISSDTEGSDQLSASSTEQSVEDEEYTGRTMKTTPKKIITQRDGARQKAVLPKGVQPCSSTKQTTQSVLSSLFCRFTLYLILKRSTKPNSLVVRNECCARKSYRRPVTEMEMENALQLASKEQTDESYIKVMIPNHDYRHFHMSIPAEWIKKHMTAEDQDLTLRVGEETWSVRFNYCAKERDAVFGSGRKKFVLDNFLEESDVCVFKLASQKGEAVILDVRIFRVVQEVTPPTTVVVS